MHDAVYHQYAEVLPGHWWVEHRRALVATWLKQFCVEPDGRREVLEIGSGVGTEHEFLQRYGRVTGVEVSEVGLGYCRQRGYHELLAGDLNRIELPKERFDLAVDFHVLYHQWIEEPRSVLRALHRSLRRGGHLVLTEPAFARLRRAHDDAVMAERRFGQAQLRSLVEGAGFRIGRLSGFLALPLPAVVLSKWRDQMWPERKYVTELERPSPFADALIRVALRAERGLLRVVPLPVGTCWALIAEKP